LKNKKVTMLVKKTRFLLLTFPVVLLFVWAVIALLLGLRSVVSNERMDWVFVFKMTPAIAFLLPVLLRIYLTASSRFRIVAIGGFARDVKIHIRQSVRLAEHSFQDKKLFIKEFEGSLVDKVVSVARTIRDGRSIILYSHLLTSDARRRGLKRKLEVALGDKWEVSERRKRGSCKHRIAIPFIYFYIYFKWVEVTKGDFGEIVITKSSQN